MEDIKSFIDTIVSRTNKPLTDKTKTKYYGIINTFYTMNNTLDIFNDMDTIFDYINSKYTNEETKRGYITPIKSIFVSNNYGPNFMTDENKDKVNKYFDEKRKDCTEIRDKQDRDLKGWTIQKLLSLLESLDKQSQLYLYIAFNVLIPPKRLDLENAVYVETMPEIIDKTLNYIIIGETIEFKWFNNHKIDLYDGLYNKKLINEDYIYKSVIPFINPEKLSQIIKNDYQNNKRFKVFNDYENIPKNLNITQNTMRSIFSQEVFINNNLTIENEKLIAYDFGEKNIITMKSYSNPNYESETETESVVSIEMKEYHKPENVNDKLTNAINENNIRIEELLKQVELLKEENENIKKAIEINNKYI